MQLTEYEIKAKDRLLAMKQNTIFPMLQPQQNLLLYLQKKEMHNTCSNLQCTGFEGKDSDVECPICKSKLNKTI